MRGQFTVAWLLVFACGDAASPGDGGVEEHDASRRPLDAGTSEPPRIILIIGDGMGRELDRAVGQFLGRAPSWQELAYQGVMTTASLSGITDSAAAATAMASGELTFNGRLGIDRDGVATSGLFEEAVRRGMSTGIVTTAPVTHATPAAFTAHVFDRYDYPTIAAQQVRDTQPRVMLGGGRLDFGAELLAELAGQGASVVSDAASLAALDVSKGTRVVGLFADGHFPYVNERTAEVPSLDAMTRAALSVLERNADGFILVLEAARIDRACHDRDLPRALGEALELERAVSSVLAWAATVPNATVIVAADHETGGLRVGPAQPGQIPTANWRWGEHTNESVAVYAGGAGLSLLAGAVFDGRHLFAAMRALVERAAFEFPPPVLVADGRTGELGMVSAVQNLPSDIGAAGRLDRLLVDFDQYGIVVGVEGTFSMSSSTLVLIIDRDFGAATGPNVLLPLAPSSDLASGVIDRMSLDLSAINGFGAEFAAVSVAGLEDARDFQRPGSGLRSISADSGGALPPVVGIAINYADGVRDGVARLGSGAELALAFDRLYPESGGSIPVGARIAVVAVLTSVLGTTGSNQALPSFDPSAIGVLSSVAVVDIDVDRDGVPDR